MTRAANLNFAMCLNILCGGARRLDWICDPSWVARQFTRSTGGVFATSAYRLSALQAEKMRFAPSNYWDAPGQGFRRSIGAACQGSCIFPTKASLILLFLTPPNCVCCGLTNGKFVEEVVWPTI